jgi:hypothetical protein
MIEICHQRVGLGLIIFLLSPFFLTGFFSHTLEEREAAIIQKMVEHRFQSNSGAFMSEKQTRKKLERSQAAYQAALIKGGDVEGWKKRLELDEADSAAARKDYEEAMAEQARTPQVVEEKKKKIRLEVEEEVRKIKDLFLEDLKVVKPNASPKEIEDIWITYLNQMLRGGEDRTNLIHGKVVDFDGNPVSGVEIVFDLETREKAGLFQNPHTELSVTTDENGLYSLEPQYGAALDMKSIQKEGYQYFPEQQDPDTFFPQLNEQYKLDQAQGRGGVKPWDMSFHSVRSFRLWKKINSPDFVLKGACKPTEPIRLPIGDAVLFNFLQADSRIRVEFEREYVHLKEGEKAEGGDLVFASLPSPDDPKKTIIRMTVLNGGIVEDPRHGYVAPEKGYQPSLDINPYRDAAGHKKCFFVKSRNGSLFTRLCFEFTTSVKPNSNSTGSVKLTSILAWMEWITSVTGKRVLEEPKRVPLVEMKVLASRQYGWPGNSPLAQKIDELQKGTRERLNQAYLCQVKVDGAYFRGYMADTGVFYKYAQDGRPTPHPDVPEYPNQVESSVDIPIPGIFFSSWSQQKPGMTSYPYVIPYPEYKRLLIFSGKEGQRTESDSIFKINLAYFCEMERFIKDFSSYEKVNLIPVHSGQEK